jgi:hypothetical protein
MVNDGDMARFDEFRMQASCRLLLLQPAPLQHTAATA